jgi:hypothetical protein
VEGLVSNQHRLQVHAYLHMGSGDSFSGQLLTNTQDCSSIPIVGLISTTDGQPCQRSSGSDSPTIFFLYCILKKPWSQVTKRIHGDDLLLISPLRERTDICSWFCVCKIGSATDQQSFWLKQLLLPAFLEAPTKVAEMVQIIPMIYLDFMTSNSKGIINRVRAAVS